MLSADALVNPLDRINPTAGSTVIAAISGGSDSTALLHLLKDSFDRRRLDVRLIAATVDHGLRPGSADEARVVGATAQALGVEHRILSWSTPKPVTGIQNAARIARHRLLADLADETGAVAVLVGHTRDDQAETVIMRSRRGDGPGLSGIAPATLFERRLWFMRPLLQSPRADLRRWLTAKGIGWIDDPSNDNLDFERVAIRQMLASSVDGDLRIAEALAVAETIGQERLGVAHRAAALLDAHAQYDRLASFRIARSAFDTTDDIPDSGAPVHALRILLAAAGGMEQLPDLPRSGDLLSALLGGKGRRFSLARAVVEARNDDIVIRRELRNRTLANLPLEARLPAPWGQFLPSFELAPATAMAALTGSAIPPPLPQGLT